VELVATPDLARVPDTDVRGQRAEADELWARVRELPESLRAPLLLKVQEELPHAEIARRLGCTIPAVKMRLSRARAMLRARMEGLE